MKILFMGTPDFACASLQALYDAGHELCGVFTRPDAPGGRGMKLTAPPVKQLSIKLDIPVHQPIKMRDGSALELVRSLSPELIAVVAYGRILPSDILSAAPFGCINVHGSLLPKYRGSAPVQWAVVKGETETGVTTMHMSEGMDEGDMIYTAVTPISETDTGGSVYDRLMDMGGGLLVKTVADLGVGIAPRMPQDNALATYAPPVRREHAVIDWKRTAPEIDCHIRGFSPWPGAWTTADGAVFRIHCAKRADKPAFGATGTLRPCGKEGLLVSCGEGALLITSLQAAGGKAMTPEEYSRGHALPERFDI